jgi:hypothetical protein
MFAEHQIPFATFLYPPTLMGIYCGRERVLYIAAKKREEKINVNDLVEKNGASLPKNAS